MTKELASSLKWWHILLIIAGCVVLWLGGIWGIRYFTDSLANAGLLGDSSGAINALFSALAFCGVVIAIILQKNELELQREELKATNAQLKAQKKEFQIQNETLKRQRFENTFFQMMSLQQEIINNLSFSYEEQQKTTIVKKNDDNNILGRSFYHQLRDNEEKETQSSIASITKTLTGRNVFSWIFDKARVILRNERGEKENTVEGVRAAIFKRGIEIYALLKYPEYFDHYFRHLYRIIKFVDESDLIGKEEKYGYVGMVRATLSRYELVWLFYNCLAENGNEKFKPLIEKYAMLKNLRAELLVKPEHEALYGSGASEYIVTSSESTDSQHAESECGT